MSAHACLLVICRNDISTLHRPSDRDINLRRPVQEQSSPVQVQEPYIGNLSGYFLAHPEKNTAFVNVHHLCHQRRCNGRKKNI